MTSAFAASAYSRANVGAVTGTGRISPACKSSRTCRCWRCNIQCNCGSRRCRISTGGGTRLATVRCSTARTRGAEVSCRQGLRFALLSCCRACCHILLLCAVQARTGTGTCGG